MGTEKNVALDYEIYIAAPLAKVWQALVDGDITKHYVYASRSSGKIEKGAPYGDKSATREQSLPGWPVILSSLKTFLETGKPLTIK